MSDRDRLPEPGEQDPPPRGPSLALLYGLLFFALFGAIALAAMIVLPFYHRR